MRYLLDEFSYDISWPSPILVDNALAIQVTKHLEHQLTMKHVHLAYHWIHECIEQGDMKVTHILGVDNLANIFTKPLGRVKFSKFWDSLDYGLKFSFSLIDVCLHSRLLLCCVSVL